MVIGNLDMKAVKKQPTWSWRPVGGHHRQEGWAEREAGLTCPSQTGHTCRKVIWVLDEGVHGQAQPTCCTSAQCWLVLHLFKVLLSSKPGKQEVGLGTSHLGHG